jgi:hypothetical protein
MTLTLSKEGYTSHDMPDALRESAMTVSRINPFSQTLTQKAGGWLLGVVCSFPVISKNPIAIDHTANYNTVTNYDGGHHLSSTYYACQAINALQGLLHLSLIKMLELSAVLSPTCSTEASQE